ncbi:MAG: ATP:cob(I)alamin adenosyltransferase [Candidatus Izemoplasmatales bacterium]
MKVEDMKRITTRRGDTGVSSNYSNESLPKDSLLFEVLGDLDELSSALGLAWHKAPCETVKTVQTVLQAIGSIVATNPETDPERYRSLRTVGEEYVRMLEEEGSKRLQAHPLQAKFYLPGSEATEAGAYYDVARAVARRAERTVVRFIRDAGRNDVYPSLKYLNRLSDYLFVLARTV